MLTVRCNQAARVALIGIVTTRTGQTRHGHPVVTTTRLAGVGATVKPGVSVTLTPRLPAATLRSLAQGKRESAAFVLTATNTGGKQSAKADLPTLVPVR